MRLAGCLFQKSNTISKVWLDISIRDRSTDSGKWIIWRNTVYSYGTRFTMFQWYLTMRTKIHQFTNGDKPKSKKPFKILTLIITNPKLTLT